MNLQISGIKTVFSGLSNEEQTSLLCDLMKISKIDSLIGVNRRTITCNEIEINPPKNETEDERKYRQYEERFYDFVMPFLSKTLLIISEEEMKSSFALWERLKKKSVGVDRDSQAIIGDKFLCAITQGNDLYANNQQKRSDFEFGILSSDIIKLELILITADFDSEYKIFIYFTDLLMLCLNQDDMFIIMLLLLGYLEEDEKEEAISKFSSRFPEATSHQDFPYIEEYSKNRYEYIDIHK